MCRVQRGSVGERVLFNTKLEKTIFKESTQEEFLSREHWVLRIAISPPKGIGMRQHQLLVCRQEVLMRPLQEWCLRLTCEISRMRGVRQHAGSQQEENGLIQWPALADFIMAKKCMLVHVIHESGIDMTMNMEKLLSKRGSLD